MQLNLFRWDAIAVGNGYQSFSRLDFNDARNHFSRVLNAVPDHPAAGRGIDDLNFWEGVFRDMEKLDSESTVSFLWDRISGFPFGSSESYESLRLSLIKHLLTLLEGEDNFYVPPDLCSGYLCLQVGDYSTAENHLRILIDLLPENGRLYAYLADALYMQGKEESAGAAYTTALLLTPHEIPVAAICNRQLVDVIQEHGAETAPIYGYLKGILPLINLKTEPVTDEARVCELLRQAEQAMHLGKHDEMVAARRGLKQLAPNILKDYLAWLKD